MALGGVFLIIFLLLLQVIGAVGFMNQRLDIPTDIDPQWAAIIESCWHRFVPCAWRNFFLFSKFLFVIKDLRSISEHLAGKKKK